MIRLLAIRHAPVAVTGIAYGQTDVPTTLDGAEVAARIESVVAEFGPATIWSSDAIRCREPAARLAERLAVPLRIDERVRELSYGAWEGRAWDALPRTEVDKWTAAWQTRSPPDGETVAAFTGRVNEWWGELDAGAHFLMAHAGVVYGLDVVACGLAWGRAIERRLDFLAARRFTRV